MDNNFVTLQEASRMMDKSVQTLRRLIKKGDLQAQRVKTPQGFHYIVSRDDLAEMGYHKSEEVLSNSPIQTPIQQAIVSHVEAENRVPPIQNEVSTSQTIEVVHENAENESFDIQVEKNVSKHDNQLEALYAIIEANHQEKMFLFRILEKMQEELVTARKPRPTFWERLADKFR